MTTDEIKKMFEKYQKNELLIKNIEDRLYRLESRIKLATGSQLPYPANDNIKLRFCDYFSVLKKLKEKISTTQKEMEEIEKLIELVEDPMLQLILRLRYIDNNKWADIAEKVHYCTDHCVRKRDKALAIIVDKIVS